MAKYTKMASEELEALDTLIGRLTIEPNFITAIVPAIVRIVPVVVRVTAAVTPAVAGGAAQASLRESEGGVKLLSGEKLSVEDLIEIRKKLSSGE